MGAEKGKFDVINSKKGSWRRTGPIALVVFLALVAGAAAFAFKTDEANVIARVKARDASSPAAAYLLGLRREPTTVARDALEEAVGSPTGDRQASIALRKASAWALGSIADRHAIQSLSDAARGDPAAEVRGAACRALGRTNDAAAFGALQSAVEDPDPAVRIAACDGAGGLKDLRLVDRLIELVGSDHSYDVQRAAARALTAMTGESYGLDHAAWSHWWESRRR